ncbi:Fc receptor-like protein 5 [Fundulus heteroclitus]|uniref:Fc receptor-like protein 5 n=1 Tax=Fundulus heteroclitus TaxID=8078 RepID=UPI00165CB7C4|nr:Fc receptor-like protein 5 [Fundulus heteroclitus]
MAFSSLCIVLSTLTVTPNQSQFFKYDRIILTCVTNSSGWMVKRTIKSNPPQGCENGWAIPGDSSCIIENAYPSDTGVYWCESERGECSNRVNLTVTAGTVILESPPYPVLEGENVTLGCYYKEEDDELSTSGFSARFYKDDVFIGTEERGKKAIKAEEGYYKCQHPSKGNSMKSWLAVRARVEQADVSFSPPTPTSIPWTRVICGLLLFILYSIILVLCVLTYRRWARARAK